MRLAAASSSLLINPSPTFVCQLLHTLQLRSVLMISSTRASAALASMSSSPSWLMHQAGRQSASMATTPPSLIAGETASCLVETGHPKDFPVIERHMNELFARGVAPLKYLFVTHQETPHCGGLGRILKTFPDAILCGDVSDYHLAFPQYEHRMRWMQEGDEIDLGGRSLMAVEPVIRDLRTTWWGFETRERVLFPGDGFAYSHYHEDGHCGLVAEEATSLDLPDVSAVFADLALFWTKFADMNVYCDRLDHLIERLGVKTIAPTHGLPITDVAATVPKVQEGLKAAALMPESGTNEKVPLIGAARA
jgi:flavorubredoxin